MTTKKTDHTTNYCRKLMTFISIGNEACPSLEEGGALGHRAVLLTLPTRPTAAERVRTDRLCSGRPHTFFWAVPQSSVHLSAVSLESRVPPSAPHLSAAGSRGGGVARPL